MLNLEVRIQSAIDLAIILNKWITKFKFKVKVEKLN